MSPGSLTSDSALFWLGDEQHLALVRLDDTGAIVAISPAAERLLGYTNEAARSAGLAGLGIAGDARLRGLLDQPPGPASGTCQLPILCANGRQLGVSVTAFHLPGAGHVLAIKPIGEQCAPEESIRQDEERYRLALQAAGIGTWDMDIQKNETRRSLLHDQCFGYSTLQPSWGYDTFLSHLVEEDRARVDTAYRNAMVGGEEYDLRFRVRWPDQSIHWLWSKGRFYLDEQGQPIRVAGIQADVTEEVTLREALRYKATHDHLTGLWNRDYFESRLTRLLDSGGVSNRTLAVLLIDIDHFKRYNDAFNHAGGDAVLKAVARRIRANVPKNALVARFGGDEFIAALPEPPPGVVTGDWIAALNERLAQPLNLEQGRVKPTVSIGVALCPDDGETTADLLIAADSAMYEAKRQGRATYRRFDRQVHQARANTLQLADRLPAALAAGEIQLFYQPQFDISGQQLVGMEALLRWFPPGGPPVPPDVFVAAAEQSGFISVLGDWVIQQACRQIRAWKSAGYETVPVAINVSSLQFMRGDLMRSIPRYLEEFGLPGRCLELELTESIALNNLDSVLEQLKEIRQFGIGIAIDDFGTGFSSLSYLRLFPIDRIKIDRAFVTGCLDIRENAAICQTVIVLAHNLGCRVIAEGVEDAEQLNFLIQQGCEEVQGYLFARPMPADEAAGFLAQARARAEAAEPEPRPADDGPVFPDLLDLDEAVRQQAVEAATRVIHQYGDRYRAIVDMAARAIDVPMAALNLIETDKVTTVVPVGISAAVYDRSTAFCNQTVRQTDVFVVEDARTHPFFQHNPAVTGPPGLRFYAGFGVLSPSHHVIGTLCLFDTKPRQLTPLEKELIAHFGALIEAELACQLTDAPPALERIHSRREFGVHLKSQWRLAARARSNVALIWLGIDGLRDINVQHGLDGGDRAIHFLLSAISLFLAKQIGVEAFRMEGDTVVLLCRNTSSDRARSLFKRLQQAIENTSDAERTALGFPLTISCGIHVASADGTVAGMDELVREGRSALEASKRRADQKIHIDAVG
ncbi:EAL domain-containing protein [Marinobacter sp. C2H3]|uniref:EAL domain-containing protein n=1 Tax=Marinobacter sp. C2H3 TaxID=3119003 RepID=UPI00300ED489